MKCFPSQHLSWLSIFVLLLLNVGCGPSHRQRVADAIAELEGSSALTIDANFGYGEIRKGQLSAEATRALCDAILTARPDPNPASYVTPGKIKYQKADGSSGELWLMQLSEIECGLRLNDGTYLRGMQPESLKGLVGEAEKPPE